jgi:hypothetical protein
MSFWIMASLWRLLGCEVFEDLSAICGAIGWGVPW